MAAKLFSPLKLRDLTLPNRIMVSPMGQYSASDGCVGPWHMMHLGTMAISGAGLLVIEATSISPDARLSPGCAGIWSDAQAEAWAPVLDFCREHGGARIGMQLMHAGRKASAEVAWVGQGPIAPERGGWVPSGASALAYPNRNTPKALSEDEIAQVIENFAAAAQRADGLGIDLIEIHSAHGYLLHNFLSPLTNLRADSYGGSLESRMRFPLAVFKAVRAVWPAHKPMGVRISATDWVEGGWSIEDSIAYAGELQALGCDYITASSGGTVAEQKIKIGPGYQVHLASAIRSAVGICTAAVGLITEPLQAEQILVDGQADMVALGRGMLYNPRWPWHAAVALGEEFFYPKQYERAHPTMRSADFLTRPAR
jgi:2,4-dienoyl-CoA reductase-like NADH-dependent reductase (Old Yellow Enzyme family)